MNRAQTYLKKALPVAPPVLGGIEEPKGFSGRLRAFFAGINRPLRNEIPIRNVIRNGFYYDWRSLSRLCGLRAFFYMSDCQRQFLLSSFSRPQFTVSIHP